MEDSERNQAISSIAGQMARGCNGPGRYRVSRHLRRMVDALRSSGSIRRPELATQLGISKQTVSELIATLERGGFVSARGPVHGARGRSAIAYEFVADAAVCLGVDLGGTKVTFALGDMLGRILAESTEATQGDSGMSVVDQIVRSAAGLCHDAGIDSHRLRACAIGVPASVHPATGGLALAANLPGLERIDLGSLLAERLGCPVRLENDVNLALAGEVVAGAAKGARNAVFVALGTGVGAAIMADGQLVRGQGGAAGEVAHLPFPGGPPDAETVRQGQLESAIGSSAILAAYRCDGGHRAQDVRGIFDAAAAGETAAIQSLERLAVETARCIAAVVAVVDPELVVLGGSIGARRELRELVVEKLRYAFIRPVAVIASAHGARAAVIGAVDAACTEMIAALFGQP